MSDTRAPKKRGRRWPWVLVAIPLLVLAGLGWLVETESGLIAIARVASGMSAGRLSIEAPRGSFAGPLRLASLRWRDAVDDVLLQGIAIDWQLSGLVRRELVVAHLGVESVRLAGVPSTTPLALPQSLRPPLALTIADIRVGKLLIADHARPQSPGVVVVQSIAGTLTADRQRYVLRDLRVALPQGSVEGSATLEATAPFKVQAHAIATGSAAGHAFRFDLNAQGPLDAIALAGIATSPSAKGKVSGTLSATATPFAKRTFSQAKVDLQGINPAHWVAGAPHAELELAFNLDPGVGTSDGAIAGGFTLRNNHSGRIDQNRIPVTAIRGNLAWKDSVLKLTGVVAEVSGGGSLKGDGSYAGRRLDLDLKAVAINAAAMHAKLKPTRLAGSIQAGLSVLRQTVNANLKDPRFGVAARLAVQQQDIEIEALRLESANASLTASGHLALGDNLAFRLEGKLKDFDPRRFANVPSARLNADLKAVGALLPQPALALDFRLADSQFNGWSVAGAGTLRLENQRLRDVAVQLNAGANRVQAAGALGAAADRLTLDIDAPALDPFGIEGGLIAQLRVGGTFANPSIEGTASSDKLGVPRLFRLAGLNVDAKVGTAADSPLTIKLKVDRLDLPDQPDIARQLSIDIAGTRSRHGVLAKALVQKKFEVDLAAEGGLIQTGAVITGWNGLVGQASVAQTGKAIMARLAAPAALRLTAETFAFGPAEINGAAWSARIASLERTANAWQTRGQVRQFPLSLAGLPQTTLKLNGEWNLTVDRQLRGEARLWRESGDILIDGSTGLGLQSVEIKLAAADRRLRAEWNLRGARLGELSGRLEAASAASGQPDLKAPWQGEVNLATPDVSWAGPLLRDGLQLGGRLDAQLGIGGTPGLPQLKGQLRGAALSAYMPEQEMKLADGKLLLDLEGDTLLLRQLSFASVLLPPPRGLQGQSNDDLAALIRKPGRIEASGRLRPRQESGQLEFRLDRVGVVQRADQWIALSGQGQLTLADGVLTVGGKTHVDAGWWQLTQLGVPRLSDDVVIRRSGAGAPTARTSALKINLGLDADFGRNFHFRGVGVESRLAGSIRVNAANGQPMRATGSIRTVGGRFDAYGQKLAIERGIINFQGLIDNPGLNIRALRKNQAVEAGVEITGTAQRPVVKLVSDPNVPDSEKLSWLIQGRGLDEGAGVDSALLLSAASTILGGQGGGALRKLQNSFGIDEFGISSGSLDGSAINQPGSRVASAGGFSANSRIASGQIVSVGKHLASNVLLSYEQALGSTENIVKLTVRLSQRLTLVGRTGTTSAVDIFYGFSFGK